MSMTDIKSAKNHGVLQQQCSILCMQKYYCLQQQCSIYNVDRDSVQQQQFVLLIIGIIQSIAI